MPNFKTNIPTTNIAKGDVLNRTEKMIPAMSLRDLLVDDFWSDWKISQGFNEIFFEGENISDLDFSNFDFSNIKFINCKFTNCLFTSANLISANLAHSVFIQCDFNHAKLIASILESTVFKQCQLENVNFLTAQFKQTTIVDTDLSHIDLQTINLKGITLDGCDLKKQNLSGKDLSYSSLKGVDLRGANLSKAIFNYAVLSSSLLSDARVEKCQFKFADLNDINLSALDLSSTNFESASLQGCDLRGADLSGSNLNKSNITNTKLFNVNTLGWNIRGIKCLYAFWDQSVTNKTVYTANEFERLYAESLIIELKYQFRLTTNEIATLPILIEHLQACHWGVSLRLKSVEDVAGGALVKLVVDEIGHYSINDLQISLKEESLKIQNAQLAMRADKKMQKKLKEAFADIKEKFWPRLLELAAEYEIDQVRNFCVLFIDLKDFTQWNDAVISEKLSLFRGLLKPILAKWNAGYPNMEGDSLRATFKNPQTAIECAWMIRHVLMAADFELRIGIDFGEVTIVHNEVTEQSDLEGMAVNMASRLESMANSGQIFVSEKLKHAAEKQTSLFSFKLIQSKLTKNIGAKRAGDLIDVYQLDKPA